MASVTREPKYVYSIHDISEFEKTVFLNALREHAEKHKFYEGTLTTCQNFIQIFEEISD